MFTVDPLGNINKEIFLGQNTRHAATATIKNLNVAIIQPATHRGILLTTLLEGGQNIGQGMLVEKSLFTGHFRQKPGSCVQHPTP